jgi:hypothetical protein
MRLEATPMQAARVRFSLRLLMVVIAVIGLAMFAVRQMFFSNPVYSAGDDESRFRRVSVAMTSSEVEGLLGPLLRTIPWWPDRDVVCWEYSAKRKGGGNYWRRDVFMKEGKVVEVMSWYEID